MIFSDSLEGSVDVKMSWPLYFMNKLHFQPIIRQEWDKISFPKLQQLVFLVSESLCSKKIFLKHASGIKFKWWFPKTYPKKVFHQKVIYDLQIIALCFYLHFTQCLGFYTVLEMGLYSGFQRNSIKFLIHYFNL